MFQKASFLTRFELVALTGVFWLLLAAAVIYLIGTFGITIFGNVPLNNTLDRFDLKTAIEE